jgi:endonuclease YncB( thermonuclease family)
MRALSRLLALALCAAPLACGSTRPPAPPSVDGGAVADAGAGDAGTVNACPAPAVVTPADLPSGFLAPQTVTLIRDTDGDTAHFNFPQAGEQIVRFLWVNTEEAYGTETTEFGTATKGIVGSYLEGAREIVVVVRESRTQPGQPALDPYNRWLGLVFVDGDLFETRLVREGWSAYYTKYGCAPEPVHKALVYAEAEARAKEKGIWAPGHPTDYSVVLANWIGSNHCRPNPYLEPYCP